jgi:digeranylgeranylglycerophospholipid reductase
MAKECDVLVVGAGPAGSAAARAAALQGAKTICIEKKQQIGIPVQCGEGIGAYLLSMMPFQIPQDQLIWEMDGILFWSDNLSIEKTGDFWKGYSVDRSRFDAWCAQQAIAAGAEIRTSAELVDITHEKYHVSEVTVRHNNKTERITPKVIVAADGVESTVLHLLDLYHPQPGDIAEVYSWEMKNLQLYNPRFEQIYAGEYTPSGYAYIFPKGKNVANIGVGGLYPKKKLETYFEEFLDVPFVKKQVKNTEYVVEKSKNAVWNNLTDKWVFGNVILAGDVANQNLKPFIEGILPCAICGDIAGGLAHQMLQRTVTHDEYLKNTISKIGEHFELSCLLNELIGTVFSLEHKKQHLLFFSIVSECLDPKEYETLSQLNYNSIRKKIKEMLHEM